MLQSGLIDVASNEMLINCLSHMQSLGTQLIAIYSIDSQSQPEMISMNDLHSALFLQHKCLQPVMESIISSSQESPDNLIMYIILRLSMGWAVSWIADDIGVHRCTIYRWLHRFDIINPESGTPIIGSTSSLRSSFDILKFNITHLQLSEGALSWGARMLVGRLESLGFHVSLERVYQVLRDVDGEAVTRRFRQATKRRVYEVPFPMFIWHHDGHHRLIRWGM